MKKDHDGLHANPPGQGPDAWQQRCLPAEEEFCSRIASPAGFVAGLWEPTGPVLGPDGHLWVMWRRPLFRIAPRPGPESAEGAS